MHEKIREGALTPQTRNRGRFSGNSRKRLTSKNTVILTIDLLAIYGKFSNTLEILKFIFDIFFCGPILQKKKETYKYIFF